MLAAWCVAALPTAQCLYHDHVLLDVLQSVLISVPLYVQLDVLLSVLLYVLQVYVYWDLDDKHPGASDPRVLITRIQSVASCYGRLSGLYCYAVRAALNWVPEAFLQYAPTANQPTRSAWECPVCGMATKGEAALKSHLRLLHPEASADLILVPTDANRSPSSTVSASSTVLPSSTTAAPNSGAPSSTLRPSSKAAAGTPRDPASQPSAPHQPPDELKAGSVPLLPVRVRNTSRRTLGKVTRYHNASGTVVVPPEGHQISMKYVLRQEGCEVG